MIGKPEWFNLRKYGGWGLAPKSKEGWVYIGLAIGIYLLALQLTTHELQAVVISAVFFTLLFLDMFHIMSQIKLDKKDTHKHYLAERNASWGMVITAISALFIQAYLTIDDGGVRLSPYLLAVLIAGAIIKTITHIVTKE